MTLRLGVTSLREQLRSSLWPVPGMLVLLSIGVAVLLVRLEATGWFPEDDVPFIFSGGPDAAQQVTATIVGSMVAFVGTVFSITMLVLQLASSQFTPRVLGTFLRDRRSQYPLGLFLGTLAYSLVVLWSIREGNLDALEPFVPRFAVTGAGLLVFVCLSVFVYYINHVAQSIRVSNVVRRIGSDTRARIPHAHPHELSDRAETIADDADRMAGTVVTSDASGVVEGIDIAHAVRSAARHDGRLIILPKVGDFIPHGAPVMRWDGAPLPADAAQPGQFLSLGPERTLSQDVAFGLLQLVDIADRALSPGVNDPTTAIQAVDQIHDLLRLLAGRVLRDEIHRDEDGVPRVVLRHRSWEELLQLGIEEIRRAAHGSPYPLTRLESLLDDLLHVTNGDRAEAVRRQLQLVREDLHDAQR